MTRKGQNRRPDLRPRLQHERADRGRAQPRIFPPRSRSSCPTSREAAGLEAARAAGVAARGLDAKAFAGKPEFEAAMTAALAAAEVELICLAGFMRILSPAFVERWRGRILNIHPSLLPDLRGLHTHERALARGARRARLHRPFRHRGPRRGADRRPGARAGAAGRRRRPARRPRARRGAPDLSAGARRGGARDARRWSEGGRRLAVWQRSKPGVFRTPGTAAGRRASHRRARVVVRSRKLDARRIDSQSYSFKACCLV